MNGIINFTLKNKFALGLITLIVIVAGLYSGMNMKLETIPNINTPLITISAVDPGATPAEIDDQITQPIERAVRNLSGVDIVQSTSRQNISSIQVQYIFDKDMDKALTEVKEAVGNIKLPDGVKEPNISRLSFNAFPVIALSATSDQASLSQLTDKVKNDIVPTLTGIEGVSSVNVSGEQQKKVEITFDDKQLAKYGLSRDSVKQVITASNIESPLGLYNFNGTEKSVVVDGNIETLNDLKHLQIPVVPSQGSQGLMGGGQGAVSQAQNQSGQGQALQNKKPIAQAKSGEAQAQTQVQGVNPDVAAQVKIPTVELQDLASIKQVTSVESISKTNGEDSINLQIVKAADANTVDVVDRVKDQVKQIERDNPDIKMISSYDQGQPIKDSVHTMISKAIFGAVFAMLIILLFLRNIRTTLIAVVSIPLSLLIAMLLLKQMDITLNLMTLGAMTIAIGRVVDDSIVVIENIYRRITLKGEKLTGKDLIREATKEMFKPIASSTIVTIAVFLPMGLVKGMVGQLFLPFALTIVFALLSSLLVAITIVPAMAHSLLKNGVKTTTKLHEGPGKLALFYRKVLNAALNHKWITSLIAVVLLACSLMLIPSIGVSFLSSEEDPSLIVTYKPAPGETLDDVKKEAAKAEDYLETRKGADTIQYSLGGGNPMDPSGSNQALFFVQYDKDYKEFASEKEKVIAGLNGLKAKGDWKFQDFSATSSSNQISAEVYGDSMEQIKPVVEELEKKMKRQSDLEGVESGLAQSYEEYTFVADQKKLSSYGLTAGQLAMALNNNQQRTNLTTIKVDGQDVDVEITVPMKKYDKINDMKNQDLQTPLGTKIKVSEVAEVKKGTTSDTISRQDGKIYVGVSGKIKSDSVSKAAKTLKKTIDEMELPSGITISMGGVTKDINESFTQLGLAMLAAIAIVYLILVITFGGGLAPFAILFSLPFTVIGGLVGLWLAGETLSVSAMIGALMLIGIVVTNAIVLVDRVIHKEEEGLSPREALLEAGMTRIRPILMTAIATIGALLPLALGYEGSGIISKGLGITVIGGLTSSTLLTLLIVPIVYESLSRFRRRQTE